EFGEEDCRLHVADTAILALMAREQGRRTAKGGRLNHRLYLVPRQCLIEAAHPQAKELLARIAQMFARGWIAKRDRAAGRVDPDHGARVLQHARIESHFPFITHALRDFSVGNHAARVFALDELRTDAPLHELAVFEFENMDAFLKRLLIERR